MLTDDLPAETGQAMGEGGFSFKPGDFYVGLVDFFGVMLPGALLTLLGFDASDAYLFNGRFMPVLHGELAVGAAFLGASFLLGKAADALGSVMFDWLTDRTYRSWKADAHKSLIAKAAAVRQRHLGEEHRDMVSEFRWARVAVRETSPSGALAVERLEASSKLLRGLTIFLLIAAGKFFWLGSPIAGLITLLLAPLALWRCAVERWQRDKTALEHYVAHNAVPASPN